MKFSRLFCSALQCRKILMVIYFSFRLPEYATRACLMSTEALKTKKMYADAAVEFIKLTNEVCELLNKA